MPEKQNFKYIEFLSQGKYSEALQQLNLIEEKKALSEDEILVKKYIQIWKNLRKVVLLSY